MIELEVPILVRKLATLISLDEGIRNWHAGGGIYDGPGEDVRRRGLLIVAEGLRFGVRQKSRERRNQYSTTNPETAPGDTKPHAHKAS